MAKKIVFLGGDKRELTVIPYLLRAGYEVESFALPPAALPEGVRMIDNVERALMSADACIMPMPPLHSDGRLHSMMDEAVYLDDHAFSRAPAGMPVLTGIITPHLRCIAGQCVLIGFLESEEIARPLAEATAEGAIAEAIRLSEGLLYGEQALVIGYGRIGRALAWRLDALGMQVVVLNRGEQRAQEARDFGFTVGEWKNLTKFAAAAKFIFNTAPTLLLGKAQLQWLKRDTLIVDLAAVPGGTDFTTAAELGVKAVLAGGLPGKYAPRFSGEIMAEVYLRRLDTLLEEDLP